MKKLTFIFIFGISSILHGQDAFGDVEKVSLWIEDVVAQAEFNRSVEVLNGTIFIEVKQGDLLSLWDASGVTVRTVEIIEEGEFELRTDYLLQGQYYFGLKRSNTRPIIYPLSIGQR